MDTVNGPAKFEFEFVALLVPEIIGGTQKFWQFLDMPTLPFLQNFKGLLFGWTL